MTGEDLLDALQRLPGAWKTAHVSFQTLVSAWEAQEAHNPAGQKDFYIRRSPSDVIYVGGEIIIRP